MSSRILANTVTVLLVTLFTTVAVYGAVSSVEIPSSLSAETSTAAGTLTCPSTGCSAVSCHATSGAANTGATTAADSSELQTCPATGCTSYGCHATDGGGGRGGRGFGHGSGGSGDDAVSGLET